MASESFFADIFKTFFRTIFRVVAVGVGLVIFFMILAICFSGPSGAPHSTTAHVLPNDEWKVTSFSQATPTILRVDVTGVIGLGNTTKTNVFKQLLESVDGELKPGQVKAILLTINTPGGVADQSDAIYRLLSEYKSRYKIPVYAYIEGLCASGGMYIACAADKVYASEDSLTGHVGVIFSPPFFNVSELTEKLGIHTKTFFAGKDKDSMDPFRSWTPNEGQSFQYIVDALYSQFIGIVSKNRPKLTKDILIAQGARIWPTHDAIEQGYVDAMAPSVGDVLKIVAKDVGIDENYQFVELVSHDFFGTLLGGKTELLSGRIEHRVRLPGDLHPDLYGKALYLYNH